MGLSRARSGADVQVGREANDVKNKEPLHDKHSRFTYAVTQKQVDLFIKIGAKLELRKIAETGKEKERRAEAVKGLAEIKDNDSIPILEEIARTDPEKEVRDEAGDAILKLKGESREFVEKKGIEELNIGEIIDDALEFAGAEDVPEADFPDFEIEDPEVEKRLQEYAKKAAIEKLRKGDTGNLYMVIELAFMDGNDVLQKKAIEAMIDSDDREALNAAKMIVGNNSANKELGGKIEIKLSELTIKEFREGDESKLAEVARMLFESENFDLRRGAFEALLSSKNPEGLDAVRLYLTEDEKNLTKKEMGFKRYMLREMDEIRHLKFLNIFIDILRSTTDNEVIGILVSSLCMYGDKKSIDVLDYTANRQDIDEDTRKSAVQARELLKLIRGL